MAEAVVRVRVLRRGTRPGELLAAVFHTLGQEPREPDDAGVVALTIESRGPQAWETVRDALDASGPDWRQWLHLEPRPRR
jgi:hypothetical protein